MTDQSVNTSYERPAVPRALRADRALSASDTARTEPLRRRRGLGLLATIDMPLSIIVGVLLVIGMMMVYSTTFDWSYQTRGAATAIFVQDHLRNVGIGLVALIIFAAVDYRFWKRFAPWLMLITLASLVAVLIFGDDTFGARRSLIGGRFQPGELAEFTIVVYLAAWLGARKTRIDSFLFGLIPFGIIIGLVVALIALQPDLSSAGIIIVTAGAMYFLSGARITHLLLVVLGAAVFTFFFIQTQPYAQDRVSSYQAGLVDPTQANYHTQQAIIAFVNGGWTGVGLGQSEQKFGALPAPHTDSVFAVIGEELGVLGASLVVMLYVVFVIRGFYIARRAVDPFGTLLAVGFTIWVAIQALLNIAVMTALVPSSGLPLPFISYGGSALLVLMVSVGLMLSVSRVAAFRDNTSNRRATGAHLDWGWGNRRSRLSRTRRRRSPANTEA